LKTIRAGLGVTLGLGVAGNVVNDVRIKVGVVVGGGVVIRVGVVAEVELAATVGVPVGAGASVNIGGAIEVGLKPQADKTNPKDAIPLIMRNSRRDDGAGFGSFILAARCREASA